MNRRLVYALLLIIIILLIANMITEVPKIVNGLALAAFTLFLLYKDSQFRKIDRALAQMSDEAQEASKALNSLKEDDIQPSEI